MVHLSLMSVYNFIRRGLVIGLAEKTAKSKVQVHGFQVQV